MLRGSHALLPVGRAGRRPAGHCAAIAATLRRLSLIALGGSSNGRTSGFGPENRGSSPCPPARAGFQAQRSSALRDRRSIASAREPPHRPDPRRRPGHAHALEDAEGAARAVRPADGAVARARGAGGRRGRVVVVDSPERALAECCRRASSSRCRRARTAPAARSWRRWPARRGLRRRRLERDAPVVVLSGDVPLVSAEAISGAGRGARAERRGGDDGDDDAR